MKVLAMFFRSNFSTGLCVNAAYDLSQKMPSYYYHTSHRSVYIIG